MTREISIMIGGEAGQGIQSMGQVLARSFSRSGLHVYALSDYESRIRGGHTFTLLRVADRRLDAHEMRIDILIALNEETIKLHEAEVTPHGTIIYDSAKVKGEYGGERFLGLDLTRIARELGGSSAMANTVAVGAAWAMIGLDPSVVESVLDSFFSRHGEDVVTKNVEVLRAGREAGGKFSRDEYRIEAPGGAGRLFVSCTETVALGALAADVRFYSAYPMTPATGVMEYLVRHGMDKGVVVEQAEDEIAAINMAIGASYMGARSMAGTSGGGFSLMSEALGLAGCVEVPLVVLNAQRPGPATGMPTRTEQGDLLFTLFASHGEFPRVVLAPSTPESAFRMTAEAFNIADRLQTPVILLTDHHLMSTYLTVDSLDIERVTIDRGALAPESDLSAGDEYLRYRFTDNGVSPRAFPGQGTALVPSTGDEHDETGHITEDPELRKRMVDKRWKKLELLDGVPGLESDLDPGAETVIIGWGSTYGAIRECVDRLRDLGRKVSMIQVTRLWPFPGNELRGKVEGHREVVVVEGNSMAQFARLMRMETGIAADRTILKYDGRTFAVQELMEQL